jgi:hypothetical protein
VPVALSTKSQWLWSACETLPRCSGGLLVTRRGSSSLLQETGTWQKNRLKVVPVLK